MTNIVFRTTDPTRWGTGQGTDLSATQIDLNFWYLYSSIISLQDHASGGADIDYFVVNGNQLYVHLMNHVVLGPYVLPTAQWNFRGPWEPTTNYSIMDVVSDNGALYMVIWNHTSLGTFSPTANDGLGHNFYTLLLAQPAITIPDGGTLGQRLAKASGSPYVMDWVTDFRNLALFIGGQPSATELLLQYVCTDDMTLPALLTGSQASSATAPSGTVVFGLFKNGASIGSITFAPSSTTFTFLADVTFVPGDVITIIGPPTPDPVQANVSITLQAALT